MTLKRLVVHRDVKERAGLGVPQSRPDLGRSLNCHVIEAANRRLTVGSRADGGLEFVPRMLKGLMLLLRGQ